MEVYRTMGYMENPEDDIIKLTDDVLLEVESICKPQYMYEIYAGEVEDMAYHFGNKADMREILKQCQSDYFVMGNLDPVRLLKMSTPEQIRKAILEILNDTTQHRNYVLSTGCDVPPNVPFDNIEAMYNAVKEYNDTKYSKQ